jgi:5'-nucleotidase
MNIVLTNDDGYDAPGLRAAFEAVSDIGRAIVVAPRTERSACSHTITIRSPITVEQIPHEQFGNVYAVEGTPADCVRLAFAALLHEPIDLVVAGINAGANAGVDIYYSGTVAAAREAAILDLKAIAVSQSIRADRKTDWNAARDITARLIGELIHETLPGPGFWSINLPSPIPEEPEQHIHRVPAAARPMPMLFHRQEKEDGRTTFAYGAGYWLRETEGATDYDVIRNGGIAVTAVPLFGRF